MRIVASLLLCCCLISAQAQKLSGQWTGSFISKGDIWGEKTEYVLELEVKGNDVSGFSYTYFIISGKRYYVICRLKGNYDGESRSVTVTEVDKVKSNTPPDFRDMFQIHALTYFKSSDNEKLVGKWKSANPPGGSWAGTTELERKVLVKVSPQSAAPITKAPGTDAQKAPVQGTKTAPPLTKSTSPAPKTVTKAPAGPTRTAPPTAKSAPLAQTKTTASPTPKKPATSPQKVTSNGTVNNTKKPETIDNTLPTIEKPKAPADIKLPVNGKIEARSKQVIKTIDVDAKTFRVDMYDNGQIDGDTISLYFNGKLMVSHQRLSTEPIRTNISIDPAMEVNELVMYAENLGSIPPNTALMVVTVGDKRYEVNISSSEQTSGTVRFRYRE